MLLLKLKDNDSRTYRLKERNNIMENKKPKFKIGEEVRVISLEEANKISYNVESNKALKKYLGKTFTVTGLRYIGGMYYYFLKEKTGVCVHECLIESVNNSEEERLKLDNIYTRGYIETSMIDVGKIVKSPMGTWMSIYIGMIEFVSTASPKTKAFIAGQLYGLTERLMNEDLKEE